MYVHVLYTPTYVPYGQFDMAMYHVPPYLRILIISHYHIQASIPKVTYPLSLIITFFFPASQEPENLLYLMYFQTLQTRRTYNFFLSSISILAIR